MSKLLDKIKAHEAVVEVFKEDGTWWVWLRTYWINPESECSLIHERTLSDCASVLRGVRLRTAEEIAPPCTVTPK